MRVMQINVLYRNLSTGRIIMELHEAAREHGFESYVAAPNLNGLETNGYKIGNGIDRKLHAFLSRMTGLQGYYSSAPTRRLLRYIDLVKPNVVHLHNLHGNYINVSMLLKYLSTHKIATVLTLHDCWFYTGKCVHYMEDGCTSWKQQCGSCPALHKGNKSFFLDRSRKMLRDKKRLFSQIENLGVVGVSAWTAADARQSVLKTAKVIRHIYNWIDLDTFHRQDREALKKKWGLSGKCVLLGVAAAWNQQKGSAVFQKLAEIIPDNMEIVLVGKVTEQQKRCKLRCLGEIHDVNQLAELYALADVFVNPTVQETFGKTVAEAMACGTPVVAYRTTAMPELLGEDGSCGVLVEERNAEAFYAKIVELLSRNPEVLSENCRSRAESLFDKDANIRQYYQLYRELQK